MAEGGHMVGFALRGLLAIALLGSAVVHLLEWVDQRVEIVRFLFMVNVAAGIIIAAGVIAWRHWLPLLAAIGFGAGTLAAYLTALTVGLFGVEKHFTTANEVWGVITEVGCIVLGGLLLLRREWQESSGKHAADAVHDDA